MQQIYANLLGVWTNITNQGQIDGKDPNTFYKEEWQALFDYDYINIQFEQKNYRIHPSMLQVVTE